MRACVLALSLALSGCTVIVLGDSNACQWPGTRCRAGDLFAWPGRLAARTAWPRYWTMENYSFPGMTAAAYPGAGPLHDGGPEDAGARLTAILAEHPAAPCVGVPAAARLKFVFSVGSNDVFRSWVTPWQAANTVLALYDRAHAARPCWQVYVATIPPSTILDETRRAQTNAAIVIGMTGRKAAARVIPFDREPVEDLGADGVHMTDAGQEHRADLAGAVLFPR